MTLFQIAGLIEKMGVRLTEDSVAALPVTGRDNIVFDTLEPGFGIRVTPAGRKIFIAQARVAGRPRRIPIGRHGGMTVVKARAEARAMLEDMRKGVDPLAARAQREHELEVNSTTVGDLADRWLAEHVRLKRKPRTIEDYERIVDKNIKPWAGHRSVAAVKLSDVMALHRDMAATPRRANYVVAVIKALFGFAERVGLRAQGTNPAKGLEMYREIARDRYMSPKEIVAAAELIARAEEKGTIGPHVAAGLKLCLFTGCRSGEATALEWSHVDLAKKIARLPDSKANRPRIIHLNGPAVEMLKALPRLGKYVVAGAIKDQPARNLTGAWIGIRKKTALEGVRLHDFRHSFASAAAAKGLSLPMIGKLLGHTVPATTARYAHLHQDPVAEANDLVAEVYKAAASKTRRGKPTSAEIIPINGIRRSPKRDLKRPRTSRT
ncbi:MAG TPA: tyrosine-type recombinase/integrase [Devosia sp.]|nr:tyrosine-type recombinase/integrase [Devosia sp.]